MRCLLSFCAVSAICGFSLVGYAEDKPAPEVFSVAEGKISFTAPAGWTKKTPKNRIIEAEFEIPAAKGEEIPGRLTVMGAGGSVEDNIKRWYGQFAQPDGGDTEAKAKVEKLEVAGQKVHLVDVGGIYKDTPGGPFAGGKPVMRANYRMLAAIVETKGAGNYFLKFYGPQQTVEDNAKAFRALVESVSVKKTEPKK